MNILHYSLGIYPYRTGGLTKYSQDLLLEQSKTHTVYLIFPGRYKKNVQNGKIGVYKKIDDVNVFELFNPQGVGLLGGINSVENFTKKANINIFKNFLIEKKIEIIHLHTFMGLYKELIEAAKILNIKVFFTTHDYYGLAPNPNFLDCENKLLLDRSLDAFNKLNINVISEKKMILMQSKFYREIKMKINRRILSKIKFKNKKNKKDYKPFTEQEYIKLKKYFDLILSSIDVFLFNSSVSEEIYKKFVKPKNSINIGLIHADIKDNRIIKSFEKTLKITFMGTLEEYKGGKDLLKIARKYRKLDIKYNFYGGEVFKEEENVNFNGAYKYSEIEKIMLDTDLLVVPSKCKETFGFTVLEGISFGVPCLVNNNIGSKDILKGFGIISDDIEKEIIDIYKNREKLKKINEKLLSAQVPLSFQKHCEKVEAIYNEYKIV
ncbi:MAG: glycosyltransferase [Sarcina sp.]